MAWQRRTAWLAWARANERVQSAKLGELVGGEQSWRGPVRINQCRACRGQPAGIIVVVEGNRLTEITTRVAAKPADLRSGQKVADGSVTSSVSAKDFARDSAAVKLGKTSAEFKRRSQLRNDGKPRPKRQVQCWSKSKHVAPVQTGRTEVAHVRTNVVLGPAQDRKSTRLNSSHPSISYAVLCLKKTNK